MISNCQWNTLIIMSNLNVAWSLIMRLDPNANLRLAHWWDSNWEPFNSTCYVISHWTSIKKLTCPIIQPSFEIKIYLTTTRFFIPPPSSPHFGRWGACHDITKSAGSQTNSKSSNNDSMTAESYKAFIKRLISNWMHTDASSQSLS